MARKKQILRKGILSNISQQVGQDSKVYVKIVVGLSAVCDCSIS